MSAATRPPEEDRMDPATDISEALLAEWWQTKPNPVEEEDE